MPEFTALALQEMGRQDQAICLLHIALLRGEADAVATGRIRELGESLHLPASANLSSDLSRLAGRGLVLRRNAGWSLTPKGRQYLSNDLLVGAEDTLALEPRTTGATVMGVLHAPVPPELAPTKVLEGVRRLLRETPWANNVMLITRYPQDPSDVLVSLIEDLRGALDTHKMRLLVASDQRADDRLGLNVVAHMWASKFGISVIEDRINAGLNANVAFETGAMIMTGRRVLVLKDRTAPPIPSDFTDHIYREVDFDDAQSTVAAIHAWIRNDLQMGACPDCDRGVKTA